MTFSRAHLIAGLLLLAVTPARAASPFEALEKQTGGRLGVAGFNTGGGERLSHRENERFPMCSTFKLLLAAHVLHRVDTGKESLDRVVHYGAADLLSYAPITAKHVQDAGMTVEQLCTAALQYSDNTAANLLLESQGGPEGLTRYVRTLDDGTTRLDRIEPALNTPLPGKELDTTTPAAMVQTLQHILVGNALSPDARQRLQQWLLGNATGAARLKAGLPTTWKIGDKTGTGDGGVVNDIGILYPPGRPPIVVAAYLSGCTAPMATCEKALAEVARSISTSF